MSANQSTDPVDTTARRTTSFGSLLKRTTSSDLLGERKQSGSRLLNKSLDGGNRPSIQIAPPALPTFEPQPAIESFGGEDFTPTTEMSSSTFHGANTTPPLPVQTSGIIEGHARSESMTHRSRYSYANSSSSFNSPRRIRRRKDPTPYK